MTTPFARVLGRLSDLKNARAKTLMANFSKELFSAIKQESLKDGFRLEIPEFGVFMVSSRKARRIRNPITKDLMMLPAEKTIHFRPVKAWKELLNGAK